MREVCEAAGAALGGGPVRLELQVETPRAVARMAEIVAAAGPECAGLHYGTYDYSASLGVAAAHQSLDHPVADYAKSVMQVAAATLGIPVVDGSSNVLPVGDRTAVHAAWDLHRRLVHRSMVRGLYQGWDLHPAQLVSRYAAVFTFYREGLDGCRRAGAGLRRPRVRWRPRRTRHRARPDRLPAPRDRLRCPRRGGGRRGQRSGPGGPARPVLTVVAQEAGV